MHRGACSDNGMKGSDLNCNCYRRMKTELMIQMDGVKSKANEQVFVMAASNLPWDLDMAVLRRWECSFHT
jgi:katanin p60 ATPase-containing subunit A1